MTGKEAKELSQTEEFKSKIHANYSDWFRLQVMGQLVLSKYSRLNPELVEKLIATDDKLIVEANDWGDTFFGFCVKKGYGDNNLGRIITDHRSYLQVFAKKEEDDELPF